VWAATHVVTEQGRDLTIEDEVIRSCGHNGTHSSGHGACMNPAHLIRSNTATRLALMFARKTMRSIGAQA
jgi:hypothetical protein